MAIGCEEKGKSNKLRVRERQGGEARGGKGGEGAVEWLESSRAEWKKKDVFPLFCESNENLTLYEVRSKGNYNYSRTSGARSRMGCVPLRPSIVAFDPSDRPLWATRAADASRAQILS